MNFLEMYFTNSILNRNWTGISIKLYLGNIKNKEKKKILKKKYRLKYWEYPFSLKTNIPPKILKNEIIDFGTIWSIL